MQKPMIIFKVKIFYIASYVGNSIYIHNVVKSQGCLSAKISACLKNSFMYQYIHTIMNELNNCINHNLFAKSDDARFQKISLKRCSRFIHCSEILGSQIHSIFLMMFMSFLLIFVKPHL